MTRILHRFAVAAALVMVVGLASCSGSAGGPGAAAAVNRSSPVVVPVTVIGGQGTPRGAHPMVEVRVGQSAPVPLLLDTGSTGLQIFAAKVPAGPGTGVAVTSTPDRAAYAGGHQFAGIVATARISLAPGFYGILGIGTNRGPNGLANPILGMPAGLGHSWSVHLHRAKGRLVLAPLPTLASRTRTTVRLAPLGVVAGNRFWDSTVHLCLVVGPSSSCAPGLFDSGTFAMQLPASRFPDAPVLVGTGLVAPGTAVTVTIRGSSVPFWRFTAGTTKSADTASIRPDVPRLVNTGVQAFYKFTITYDNVHGTISLVAPH